MSRHTQKWVQETISKRSDKDGADNKGIIKNRSRPERHNKYNPPLPTSILPEPEPEPEPEEEPPWKKETQSKSGDHYGEAYRKNKPTKFQPNKYDPPLPTSVVKDDYNSLYNNKNKTTTPTTKHPVKGKTTGQPRYEPPLPDSLLEIKSTKGKHSTEKPVALMEWVLKYYSKEGDVVLDPTMGSGSTGVACKNLNRQFIGIELDPEIFEVASQRLGWKYHAWWR